MFDHLLAQISRHGLIDVELSASGDVEVGWHHIVEDVGIVLGRALRQAVGDGSGIIRTGHSFVPLDETLALVAIDLSGRGYPVIDAKLSDTDMGSLSASLVTTSSKRCPAKAVSTCTPKCWRAPTTTTRQRRSSRRWRGRSGPRPPSTRGAAAPCPAPRAP